MSWTRGEEAVLIAPEGSTVGMLLDTGDTAVAILNIWCCRELV